MALSNPRSFFGVHSVTPYSRTDGTFYGIMKCLKGSSLSMSGETIDLMGGASRYPWASEDGVIKAELSIKCSQFENWMHELFLGKAPTPVAAETAGNCSALTNVKGTSVLQATTGIASVAVKTAADLKFGKYIVKCTAAATVDVYFSSDLDITRGTDGTYQDDYLKVNASAFTITTGGTKTEITNFGLEFTGGSGTIGMTTGDTASFEVRPINTGGMTVTIGGSSDTFPEFGAIIYAQKRSSGELMEIDCFRCKAIGMPMSFESKAWSETELKIKLIYDSVKNGLFSERYVSST